MTKIAFFKGFTVIFFLISISSFAQGEKLIANKRPNVILIMADDMGYGEIEALNLDRSKIPTPILNNLVAEGVTFTDAHTSSSVCTPSRYAMLTGRYNWRTRLQNGVVQGGGDPLIAKDRITLGNLFQQQGYSTSLVGKWHLEYHYNAQKEKNKKALGKLTKSRYPAGVPIGTQIIDGPVTRGFDTFYGFHHSGSMSSIVRNNKIVKEIDVIDVLPSLTSEAVSLIDEKAAEAKAGKPFFIYFAQNAPHTPIAPAKEWQGKTSLGSYGDFVAQTDGSVGEVLEALKRNGLSKNTIVIFTADNGTSKAANIKKLESQGHFPSAYLRGFKSDLWDGGHRVPFIVRWPQQIKPNSTSKQLICLSDFMATFAEMFSVNLPENQAEDSQSFLNVFAGKLPEYPREAIVHHSFNGRFSIRQGDWKLLLAPGSGGWSAPKDIEATAAGLPEMQLYNINEDLSEGNNLIKKYPEKVKSLINLLEKFVEEGRSTPGKKLANDSQINIRKVYMNYSKKRE